MNILMFYPISALVIMLALGVLAAGNAVHCAMLLVGVMVGVAGLFLCLGCELLAMLQVLVYAGAIMVLFLFIVMTVDTRKEEGPPRASRVAQVWGILLTGALGLIFLVVGAGVAELLPPRQNWLIDACGNTLAQLQDFSVGLMVHFLGAGFRVVGRLPVSHGWLGDAHKMGEAFLNEYALPFEAITLVLLAAMVGVVVMTRGPMFRSNPVPHPTTADPAPSLDGADIGSFRSDPSGGNKA